MKHLKSLVCVMAIASLALFTGCGGDDNGGGTSPAPSGGTDNARTQAEMVGHTVTMDNGDSVTINDNSNYHATFGGIAESGTYTYVNNGNSSATLSLSPNDGSASSTLQLTFNDKNSGSFTLQETGGTGTFTIQ
jgi:hypothetical protein